MLPLNDPKWKEFKGGYEAEIKEIVDVIHMRDKGTWDATYTLSAVAETAAVFGQIQLAKIIIELEDPEYRGKVGAFIENFEDVTDWMDSKGLI